MRVMGWLVTQRSLLKKKPSDPSLRNSPKDFKINSQNKEDIHLLITLLGHWEVVLGALV